MSVFTYEPEPVKVVSPWLVPLKEGLMPPSGYLFPTNGQDILTGELKEAQLIPEPQDGPVEYKLHLLLRPRRAYKFLGAHTQSHTSPEFPQHARVVGLSNASQARQDRCQHLTTQLLWRLRQSTPYHASVMGQNLGCLPVLPEDDVLKEMEFQIGKPVAGLEESQGALYEIGVADDGSLVGLTKKEMHLSICILRWMAANLGCSVAVKRVVWVGQCEVTDEPSSPVTDGEPQSAPSMPPTDPAPTPKTENLCVVEAFVGVGMFDHVETASLSGKISAEGSLFKSMTPMATPRSNEQLRVTLTGPTGSGKSTLLGALTTGEYDDGKGKGRLYALKHRHEMESGMTSTVTHELMGYSGDAIVNYANPNIESWFGIHDYAKHGRLVLVSDSAGHPRFRRTTLRGLVGWAPHWTLLCISASEDTPTAFQDLAGSDNGNSNVNGTSHHSTDLSPFKNHLNLCLELNLPLVIVLTKLDLTNKASLKRLLAPVWTAVKGAGRTPQLIKSKNKLLERADKLCGEDIQTVRDVLAPMLESRNFCATVPVVLESSVTGDGVGLLHALLRELPLPTKHLAHDQPEMVIREDQPEALFHIEDKFSRPESHAHARAPWQANVECVVSGYVRFGRLKLGQTVTIGPFPVNKKLADCDCSRLSSDGAPVHTDVAAASRHEGEWCEARIVSIRNMRLSVQSLEADQAGSLGLSFSKVAGHDGNTSVVWPPVPRRGMIVAVPNKLTVNNNHGLQATSVLTAFFKDEAIRRLSDTTLVTFFVASIRAQAEVTKVWEERPELRPEGGKAGSADNVEADVSGLDLTEEESQGYYVRLKILFNREWVELGSKIVILEGASREGDVLDGFVGNAVAISGE